MSITEATKEDVDANTMAESNMMVDRDEDYNTRYGGYKGSLLAFERTKLIPRSPAKIDLTAMASAAGADTVDKVVDHFVHRFLSVTLPDNDREACSWTSCATSSGRRVSSRAKRWRNRSGSCSIWC